MTSLPLCRHHPNWGIYHISKQLVLGVNSSSFWYSCGRACWDECPQRVQALPHRATIHPPPPQAQCQSALRVAAKPYR